MCTLNTRTLRTPESLNELELALSHIKWDIVGLSEVRRLGKNIEDHGSFLMYYKGVTPGQYGTGFLVKPELKPYIEEFIGISERIVILNIKLPHRKQKEIWSIIQVYSPTELSKKIEIESFYSSLTDAIKTYGHKNLIVMGDYNARIGSRGIGEELVMGPYCSGKRTRNGGKLIQLAYENNMKILNSVYKQRNNNRWTWISPDGLHKNEIDYILTTKPKMFHDCRVINNLNFNTNHRMVRAKLHFTTSKKDRPFILKPTTTLIENSQNLKENLENFTRLTGHLDTQNKYEKFEELLHTKESRKPKIKYNSAKWLTRETKELLKIRTELISLPGKTKQDRQNISKISNKIKVNMRKDRQRHRLALLENCIERTGGTKKVKKQLLEKIDWIPNISDKTGKCKTSRPEIISIATSFFRDLYIRKDSNHPTDITGGSVVPDILPAEVEKAIKTQRRDKAPGADGISNEFLTVNIDILVPPLTNIFNDVLHSENIPNQWTTSTITLLHKKGDKNNINNYRPISLMSNIYKIFTKIILNRMTKILDESQPREQAGFRSGYSTLDHIYVVKQLFEKAKEFNITLYCCFVDYSKAFDSLKHDKIWQALINQGVEIKYTRILKNVYENSKAKIKLDREGEEIKIGRGVRQGDPVSPKLFTAVLEEVFRKLNWDECGLSINGENLSHLRFADDLIIISPSKDKLNKMICDLDTESQKVGLCMNTLKTKAMTNGKQEPIYVNNHRIEYVNEYLYLGQIISPHDLTTKELDRRIGNGWKQYWNLKEVMKNKEMSMTIKRKLFDTCILPVLTYGCQTWALNKSHYKKLEICQNAMERSMMGKRLSDKVRNIDIKKCTKTKDITTTIKKLKWKWAGHTIRGREKWSKAIMYWFTRDKKRKRGRPTRRWEDEIKSAAGGCWTTIARDRDKWKELGEAFAYKRHTNG